jgi:hypothetical protein
MKQKKTLLKVAVILSSALLVAGFVAYRAGAFNEWLAPPPSGSIENETPGPNGEAVEQEQLVPPIVMSGSKSALPATTLVPPQSSSGGSTIIGGSKSLAPLIPASPPPQQAGSQPPAQQATKPGNNQ